MATGDLKNNIKKLQVALRSVQFPKELDVNSLSKGISNAFLPIYHFLFLEYSHYIAKEISDLDIDVLGKSDLRFMESLYKVFRELFTYKPPITKEQFFTTGFSERKIIMCTEVVQLVRARHKKAAPKQRPVSAGKNKLGPRQTTTNTTLSTATVSSEPEEMVAKVTSKEEKKERKVRIAEPVSVAAPVKPADRPVKIPDVPRSQGKEVWVTKPSVYNPTQYEEPQEMAEKFSHISSTIQDSSSVEVIDVDDEFSCRPIDIIAKTPNMARSKPRVVAHVETSHLEEMVHTLTNRVGMLESRLAGVELLESRLSNMERLVSQMQSTPAVTEEPRCSLTDPDVSCMLARITLLESRLSMSTNDTKEPNVVIHSQKPSFSPLNDFDPTTFTQNGLEVPHYTSTPVATLGELDRPITETPENLSAADQAHRISKLLTETQDLLHTKNSAPFPAKDSPTRDE